MSIGTAFGNSIALGNGISVIQPTFSPGDLTFTLSGGTNNSNPDGSLGGNPSIYPIANYRLFTDITTEVALLGITDYRCFYLNNENTSVTLANVSILIRPDSIPPGPIVKLGFTFANERQTVIVVDAISVTSGSFTLTYTNLTNHYDFVVPWNVNIGLCAVGFQEAIQALPNLQDILVSVFLNGNDAVFEIDFVGTAGNRYHDILTLKSNTLSPATSVDVEIVVNGSPINNVPSELPNTTTMPSDVSFLLGTTLIGDLRPLDSVSVWVQRVVPPNTGVIINDGFIMDVTGSAKN